jgi:hypothetical protein
MTEDAVFVLACTGPGGSARRSVPVTVGERPPAPVISLSADVARAGAGRPVTLTWSASNAQGCRASATPAIQGWGGAIATSGSRQIATIGGDTSFALECEGLGGTDADTVSVAFVPEPTLSVSTAASAVPVGESVSLSWSSTDSDGCEAVSSPAVASWTGALEASGSRSVGPLDADTAFALTCSGEGGIVSDGVEVRVDAGPPEVAFGSTTPSVDVGGSVTLEWAAEQADRCVASGAWSGERPPVGSAEVGPIDEDASFTLECTGVGGSAVDTRTVVVRSARLSWTPPTRTVDGSPIDGLSGFRIYYGSASGNYSLTLDVNDPRATQARVDGLASGKTWYFVVTAVDAEGRESAYSNEGSKSIP